MFLAVGIRKVIDVAFVEGVAAVAAVPEIVADPAADPPIIGVPRIAQIIEVIEVIEISHNEVSKVFLEFNDDDIVAHLQSPNLDEVTGEPAIVEYYEIVAVPGSVILNSVAIKIGTRQALPEREVVEIEADGKVVGRANRDK